MAIGACSCPSIGILVVFSSLLGCCDISFAEEADANSEVVVTANRIITPKRLTASSTTTIDQEAIEARKTEQAVDLIKEVPGVDIVQSGGPGGNAAMFIRGANSEHTLVLIDGLEVNNPILPTRAFNFASMSLDNLERIEVLRGPQSTLYGSDALGGVISFISKAPKMGFRGSAQAMAGSYGTYIEQASLSGADEALGVSLGVSRQDIGGISAADTKDGNSENDNFESNSGSLRIGADPSERLHADLFLRVNDTTSDLDNFGGVGGDDLNRRLDETQVFTRGMIQLSSLDGDLKQSLGVGYSNQEFDDNNDPDILNPLDLLRSNYKGELLKFDFQNTLKINNWLSTAFGAETEEEQGSSTYLSESAYGPFSNDFAKESVRSNGYFLELQAGDAERFLSTVGLRVDDHDVFGSEVTYRIAPTYIVTETDTKLSASFGTGFRAPSLFQLYSSYGDPNLEPEKSRGVDATLEQFLDKKVSVGMTYFYNWFDNLISFDPETFKSQNIAKAQTKGIEVFSNIGLSSTVTATASYTLTKTRDELTGQDLLRRPEHKASFAVQYRPIKKLNLGTHITYIGARIDNDFSTFPASDVTLSNYTLVGATASYNLSEQIEVFARLENLLDQEYQEVLGYGTLGSAAYGGVKVTL